MSAPQNDALTAEEYSKAMNFVGQHLLSALQQSVEQLPKPLRSRQLVAQALSAFLTNTIYKQYPDNQDACQYMLDEITKLVKAQLNSIPQAKKVEV